VNIVHKLLIAGWIAAGIVLAYTVVSDANAAEDETFVHVWFEVDTACVDILSNNGVVGLCLIPTNVFDRQYAGETACNAALNRNRSKFFEKSGDSNQAGWLMMCLPIATAYEIVATADRWRRESSF
jgi:hypothetical protein